MAVNERLVLLLRNTMTQPVISIIGVYTVLALPMITAQEPEIMNISSALPHLTFAPCFNIGFDRCVRRMNPARSDVVTSIMVHSGDVAICD